MANKLKEHISVLAELEEEAREVYEVKADIANGKADIAMGAIVSLLEKVEQVFGDLAESQYKVKHFDDKLSGEIKSAIAQLGKFKDAKIEIKNEIPQLDTKPFQSIASEIASQNKELIDVLKNQPKSDNSELHRQIIQLISNQTSLIEAAMKSESNEIEVLKKILEKVSEKKSNSSYTMKTVKDHNGGFITTFKPE